MALPYTKSTWPKWLQLIVFLLACVGRLLVYGFWLALGLALLVFLITLADPGPDCPYTDPETCVDWQEGIYDGAP